MNITEQTRSHAWRQMFMARTCPPISVLKKGGAQVEKHLASCAACRNLMKNVEVYKKVGAGLARLSVGKTEQTPVKAGDIRRIRPLAEPSAWFDTNGRYHNPPLALVLDEPDEDGFVRVAQVFSDPLLAAEGDLDLGDAAFAECWNIYGLPVFGLADKAYQKVDKELALRVLESDGMDPPPLGAMSVLRQFRLCELETGAFFSMALNAEAMERLEAASLRDEANSSILAAIGDNQKGCALASLARKWDEFLVSTTNCMPDFVSDSQLGVLTDSLPLAAAPLTGSVDDGADQRMRAACLLLEQDGVETSASTSSCDLHIYRLRNEEFIITAYCPAPVGNGELNAVILSRSGDAHKADIEKYEDGFLRVTARIAMKDDSTPYVAIWRKNTGGV